MIARLRGTLLEKQPTRLVVEVGGLGLEVLVPLSVTQGLGEPGVEVDLHTVLVVREDALTLYGFRALPDRRLFLKLIGVSGIGPKIALSALSNSPAEDLVQAIRNQEIALLTRLPGIGKKTAERLAVELKDALEEFAGMPGASQTAPAERDAVEALVALGYGRAAAAQAVRRAVGEPGEGTAEALIRRALVRLSGETAGGRR